MIVQKMKQALRVAVDGRAWRPSRLALMTGEILHRNRNAHAGFTDEEHLREAARWIERAQDASGDGGICGRYSLSQGWSSSYPETTGYIVPTLLRLADVLGDARYRERARRAIDFLLSVQLDSGAFPGMEVAENRTEPSIFNSAQIVCGLRAWHAATGDGRAIEAARRACDWLVDEQDGDGAWRKHLYGNVPYTYMAHAACWIAELGDYLQHASYLDSARRHLEWVLSHCDADTGWFDYCGFEVEEHRLRHAPTHSIAYTIWGVLMISRTLGHPEGIAAARTAALAVARRFELSRWLPGSLDYRWQAQASYCCLTGNAQMALIWLELHRLNNDLPLLSAACKAIDSVKRAQQMRSSDPGIRGGIAGSDPVWGSYIYMQIPSWSAKFFIDALVEKRAAVERLRVPAAAPSRLPPNAPSMPGPPPETSEVRVPIRTVFYASPRSKKVRDFVESWSSSGYRPDAVVIFREPEPAFLKRLASRIRDDGFSSIMRRLRNAPLALASLAIGPAPRGAPPSPPVQAVTDYCREKGIPVVEVDSTEGPDSLDALRALNPDLAIHAGAGILRPPLLDIPRLGTINAHMGVLPRYRGMNAAEWSRLHGDPVGCTVHLIDPGIDTGDMIGCQSVSTDQSLGIAALRDAVDKAQIEALGVIVRYVATAGKLPPLHPQLLTDGRQFFAMHPDLCAILERAVRGETAA